MPNTKFQDWVKKWKIGPGMNDNRRGTTTHYSGFDGSVGDGWIPLLDELAKDLVAMGWDRDLHQVKEKFGTLCFYVGGATKEMHERIHKAEAASAEICEFCGKPGTRRGGGWIVTLCDACHVTREENRKKERGES